jgi:hypothetical protein NreA
MSTHAHKHPQHPQIAQRLKRAHGHLDKVIAMIEGEEPCLKVAQQLQAVSSAIENAKRVFVQQHIEGCLDESLFEDEETRKKHLEEFKEITKYL